jgi:GNAT superfamily N-acetyltransferase
VNKGTRVICLLIKETGISGTDLMGFIMLLMPSSETSKSRGVFEMLAVHQDHRGKGAARRLMAALEADALRRGRTTLVRLYVVSKHALPANLYDTDPQYGDWEHCGKCPGETRLERGWQDSQLWHDGGLRVNTILLPPPSSPCSPGDGPISLHRFLDALAWAL